MGVKILQQQQLLALLGLAAAACIGSAAEAAAE
jgi:hypothetical protein